MTQTQPTRKKEASAQTSGGGHPDISRRNSRDEPEQHNNDTPAPEAPRRRETTRDKPDAQRRERESSRAPPPDNSNTKKTEKEKEKVKGKGEGEGHGLMDGIRNMFGAGSGHPDDHDPGRAPKLDADDPKKAHREKSHGKHAETTTPDSDGFGLIEAKQAYEKKYKETACMECGELLILDRETNEPVDPQPTPICNHCGQEWPKHAHYPPIERGTIACKACSTKLEQQRNEEQKAKDMADLEKNAPKESWPDNARRKALVIACNYYGQGAHELKGPKDDAFAMRDLLEGRGYKVVVLLDQLDYPPSMRHNILKSMEALVKGARAKDHLFLHFSGHGGQTRTRDPDELDGEDEGIYPADFKRYKASEKMILDNEMHEILTQIPPDATMTCVFDSCHSGSVLDLKFLQPGVDDVKLKSVTTRHQRTDRNSGRIVLFSGCMDTQSSMDTVVRGKNVGAMSSAFIRAIQEHGLDKENKMVSIYELLGVIREKIKNHENEQFKTQTPVISSNMKLNLHDAKFSL